VRLFKVEYEFFEFEAASPTAERLGRQLRLYFADAPRLYVSWSCGPGSRDEGDGAAAEPPAYTVCCSTDSNFFDTPDVLLDVSGHEPWAALVDREVALDFLDAECQVLRVAAGSAAAFCSATQEDALRVSALGPSHARAFDDARRLSAVTRATLERLQREPTWLSSRCGLSPETIAGLLPFYLPLAEHIAARRRAQAAPLVVGIQGPQGAGKTTLTRLLQEVLRETCGLTVASLSIDDLYLTRAQRSELAQRVHALFVTRGVPGTHDVALGVGVLDALTRTGRTRVPRFDKVQDDRLPENSWTSVDGPCDVVLFEGLWIGVPPIDDATLQAPVNELEALEDPEGIWRRHANARLREDYPALSRRCQLLVHVRVPDFACVKRWRSAAEEELRAQSSGSDSRLMDAAALARFFQHYERFTAHAMASMPGRAEVILEVDREHRVVDCRLPERTEPGRTQCPP
jgi:D-glycerate 3-kinase